MPKALFLRMTVILKLNFFLNLDQNVVEYFL